MHRLRVAAIVVLAVLLAAQLTLHNHSLIPEGSGSPALTCAICAFGADRASLDAPLFGIALISLGLILSRGDVFVASAVPLPTFGRAPPRRRR